MTFKNRTAQVIKLLLAGLTLVPLAVRLAMKATFAYLFSVTLGAVNPIWPAKLTNHFIAFLIIDQVG